MTKVSKARDVKVARKLLIRVIDASRKHFDKEERIVFPLAERVLKADTLRALGNEWKRRREAILK